MIELTDKQQEIFRFLQVFTKDYGYPPTVKEIMEHFNFASPTAVTTHLTALEKKGYVKKTGKRARGSVPIGSLEEDTTSPMIKVPLLEGEVKAGISMGVTDECIVETYMISKSIAQDEGNFLMKVKGDSMIGAYIKEDDMVLVKPTSDAQNGDIVVAKIDTDGIEEITVKRFFKEKNFIKLSPENKKYKPIIKKRVNIVGKVIGVIRLNV